MWATPAIFEKTIQSEQSPIGQKFAESGHPGCNLLETDSKLTSPAFLDFLTFLWKVNPRKRQNTALATRVTRFGEFFAHWPMAYFGRFC
jgi:hypothetical protein